MKHHTGVAGREEAEPKDVEDQYEETRDWSKKSRWDEFRWSFSVHTEVVNILNAVDDIDRVFWTRVVHESFPVVLERETFENFVPKRKALSGCNRIQSIVYPIISIPRKEDNQKDHGKYATENKSY